MCVFIFLSKKEKIRVRVDIQEVVEVPNKLVGQQAFSSNGAFFLSHPCVNILPPATGSDHQNRGCQRSLVSSIIFLHTESKRQMG